MRPFKVGDEVVITTAYLALYHTTASYKPPLGGKITSISPDGRYLRFNGMQTGWNSHRYIHKPPETKTVKMTFNLCRSSAGKLFIVTQDVSKYRPPATVIGRQTVEVTIVEGDGMHTY